MNNYKTGSGPQSIKLAIDLNTIGLAASRASIKKATSPALAVATSNDASGDIATKEIGSAASCSEHKLIVMSKVDLGAIPNEEERKAEAARLTSSITLNGGIDGFQVFPTPDFKQTSDDNTIVMLYTEINLIQE